MIIVELSHLNVESSDKGVGSTYSAAKKCKGEY